MATGAQLAVEEERLVSLCARRRKGRRWKSCSSVVFGGGPSGVMWTRDRKEK
jgi:hypothetical protein